VKVFHGFSIGLLVLATMALLGMGASEVAAYRQYSQGCHNCHGGFRTDNYVSNADNQAWGSSLHDGHQKWVNGDCSTCHTSPGRSPVTLSSSDGGDGLAPIACLGCHGRDEGSRVTATGLRQHHFRNGVSSCTGCHSDSNPANATPVGEIILPPYYASPGTGHFMPGHPGNLLSQGYPEDVLGQGPGTGLDNDGDNVYDTNDPDCSSVVPVTDSTWGRIKMLFRLQD
jgi:hypothetical protein